MAHMFIQVERSCEIWGDPLRKPSSPASVGTVRRIVEHVNASSNRRDRLIDGCLWALTLVFATGTMWFSFVSPPPGANLFPGADKVQHCVAYFATALSFLFAAVWRPGRGDGPFAGLGNWILVGVVVAGVAIELIQAQTPDRSAEFADVVAEAVGASAALVVHTRVRRWTRPADGLTEPDT
jgi:VanZ family protein